MSTAADTDGLAGAAAAPKRAASTEVIVTFFQDWGARTKTEERLSLDALAKRIRARTAPAKEELPWLKFARFGWLLTKHGSLRWNGNVKKLSGVVGEHDGEQMNIDEGIERLDKAGITALVYSPSHIWLGLHGPRWRVCCPFSDPLPPDQHDHMMSRLNGVLGGALAPESWTLSQSYYFGTVEGRPEPQVEIVDGTATLDQCDDLDEIAVGKPNGSVNGHAQTAAGDPEAPIDDIVAALEAIPNDDLDWTTWNTIGMATWRASGGVEDAFEAFKKWSQKSGKYDPAETRFRWDHYATSPPSKIGFGTLAFRARQAQPGWTPPSRRKTTTGRQGISLGDFYAYMPLHKYIYAPSREMWPASSINARIPPVPVVDAAGCPVLDHKGQPTTLCPSLWLDQNKPVEQMTWAPGLPMEIRDRLISDGGWIRRSGVSCFNLYRPPIIGPGDPASAGPWLDHVRKVFPEDGHHIVTWLAHRVQRPQEKINHALVLGGKQGIGKDTILEPVKHAVGPWNFAEVSPQQLIGRFNPFVKSVILRISEARDLGDVNRYQFYDHLKAYTAAPPDVLLCDEKNLREHSVFNCCGVIITTNHKTDGIYLPEDDRRHYVAWSDVDKEDFNDDYWLNLYHWYERGGTEHVAAYLANLDISGFNPKAPPPKTQAFWEIVDTNRAPEDAELADILDLLDKPDIVTVSQVVDKAQEVHGLPDPFADWLKDRRNSRRIPHRFEACGYVAVRNENAKSGLWVIDNKRQIIYAKAELTPRERMTAAMDATSAR